MKLNLDFYKEELDKKQISEEYEEVLGKVINAKDEDFSKTLDKNSKIKNVIALSEVRENLFNWYEFKENSNILEMNANYGELTDLLCKNAKNVISFEQSKKYADIIEKRHINKENLELIVGNIENIKLEQKFNYIIIVGIADELERYIEYAKKHLEDDGKILIAVNNKFGVKSWITTKEEAKVPNNQKTTTTRKKLEQLLENLEYKFYYPLPDYKLPNIIYTEKHLPDISTIYRDLTYKDENVNFKEVDAYKEIIENDLSCFKYFANSFLVEASKEKLEDKELQFITFSNIRKDCYRIKTIINKNNVYKVPVNEKSKDHIEQIKSNIDVLKKLGINTLDSYDEEKIISKYTDSETLADALIKTYKENGKDTFYNKIKEYVEFLKEKLEIEQLPEENIFKNNKIEIPEELLNKLTFVKYGFWDLIFQNCFIIDNKYYFYDQEWKDDNLPVEYILYRAIIYFNESKEYVSDEEIFEEFKLTEFTSYFKELDNKIQEKIRKPLAWNIHSKEEVLLNKYKILKKQIADKDVEIENLRNINASKENEIMMLKNSVSWKITKPLRKIRGLANKK